MTDGPSREDLLAVCTLARGFGDPGFVAGAWIIPKPREDGVLQLGYWHPSQNVARWQTALYEHHIVLPFDWTEPEWTFLMRRYQQDPSLLGQADLATVRQVLTTLVRAERFHEGTLATAFKRGLPQAAMMRLATLALVGRPD